ncbi:putative methyltransferase-domain-containing protein [Mycena floridula]|nr:putative methyltransferase-domain-containing protein [Mycena floridula]
MPKVRKRKVPVTVAPLRSQPENSSKPISTRTVIRRFHVLLKRQAQLSGRTDPTSVSDFAEVEEEIRGLGGLEAYQKMSVIGQGNDRGGGSEKVLISWLKELQLHQGDTKLKLFEVGALKPDNYASCRWITSSPIDLHSRHPDITEQDFLLVDVDAERGKWDIVSLSLVLNFVPNARDRGRMLHIAHQLLAPAGYLFLALPLPCFENSRYMDFERLTAIMISIGFMEIKARWKPGGKMVYWLFQKCSSKHSIVPETLRKKEVLRQGNRNNFSILL